MEETKSRRNKKILIVSAMLVLLIAILCFAGTTLAKYITSKDVPTTSATVAKWGFLVDIEADGLFGDQYNAGEIVARAEDGSQSVTVDVAATTAKHDVVAPGTSGKMTFHITGKAEVAAKIAVAATVTDVSLKKADGTVVYAPIKWTLKQNKKADSFADGNADVTVLVDAKDAATLATELGKINANEIAPNAEFANAAYYELSWSWAYETGATDDEKKTNNEYDTLLASATQTDGATTATVKYKEGTDAEEELTATYAISFGMSITVEQVRHTA